MARKINGSKTAVWSFLCASTWLLASCATTPRDQSIPVTIVSEPPGARVEANGQFIGNTPLKTEIHRYRNPDTGAWYGLAINAFPTRPGQCSQQKVFPENAPMATTMYFDMSLCPVAPVKPRAAG